MVVVWWKGPSKPLSLYDTYRNIIEDIRVAKNSVTGVSLLNYILVVLRIRSYLLRQSDCLGASI